MAPTYDHLAYRLKRRVVTIAGACALLLAGIAVAGAPGASAQMPWWHISAGTTPTDLVPGSATDDVQSIYVNATGGTFTLTRYETAYLSGEEYNESVTLGYGATPAEVQTELEGEEMYGAGNVAVTQENPGAPYVVTFTGSLADLYVKSIGSASSLTGGRAEVVVSQLTEGHPDGEVFANLTNVGDDPAGGAGNPVTVTDALPETITPTTATIRLSKHLEEVPCTIVSHEVKCSFSEAVPAYSTLRLRIAAKVTTSASARPGEQRVSIEGGGAPAATVAEQLSSAPTSPAVTPFAVESYEMLPENEGGSPDTEAGSHPFQLTTSLDLNRVRAHFGVNPPDKDGGLLPPVPAALPRNLHFALPPGLLGNPTVLAQCTEADFVEAENERDKCPADTAIGVAAVTLFDPVTLAYTTETVPLFNLTPARGEPARFGFYIEGATAVLDTAVRTGGGYNVIVNVNNIPQSIAFTSEVVTFWGTPGAASHYHSRGWTCLTETPSGAEPSCQAPDASTPPPFLVMPTSCPTELQSSVQAEAWTGEQAPAKQYTFANSRERPFGLDGCNQLSFGPSISATPDGEAGSTPTGLNVAVHVPQEITLNPTGRAVSDVKSITVALPAGVQLSPSAADGLQACSQSQVGSLGINAAGVDEFNGNPVSCPEASKLATVKIKTPLLPNELEGAVYLASPQNFAGLPENPFSSLVAMYLVAEDPTAGVLVKLAGDVSPSPVSGQVTATFESPQLPFEEAKLEFFSGARAPLATPAFCGTYTTTTSIAPWSGAPAASPSSQFSISSGPNGSSCTYPGQALPFAPTIHAGTTSNAAGAFSPLTTTIGREDGQQSISSVQLRMPPGLSGILTGVPLCGEAQANAGTCGSGSLIGSTIVSVGLGGDPYSVTGGRVYLTGPYEGAPFGLSIVNPAQAGPFVLDEGRPVVVRAKIEVDPHTAQLTITTNSAGQGYAIPTILDGIPLQIKHVNVTIERQGFTFNPTNCGAQTVTGTISSAEGASSPVGAPFQVTNCAALGFAPKFAVSTPGHTSKKLGAGLTATVTYPKAAQGTQEDIKAVKVDLPKQLPSQLKTLQKACTAKQFEAGPEGCPKHSVVGEASVTTPLLPVPLTGKAYFVSHGGEAFPSLTMVLKGYGVTIDLVGSTFIHAGITSSTFKSVPDLPFSKFTLTLNQGEYAALAANLPAKEHGDLCGQKLAMPTAFVSQDGTEIHESTKISISGCAKTKKKASKKKPKKNKQKRKKG